MAEFPILLTPQFAGDITPGAIQFQPLDFSNLLKTLSAKNATVPKEDRIELPKLDALNGATMQVHELFKDIDERQRQIVDAYGAQGYYSQEYQNLNSQKAAILNVNTVGGLLAEKNISNKNKEKINANKNGDHIDIKNFFNNQDEIGNYELVTMNERYLRENVNAASDYLPSIPGYQEFLFNEDLNVDGSLYDGQQAKEEIRSHMGVSDDQIIAEGKLGEYVESFKQGLGKAILQTTQKNKFEQSDYEALTAGQQSLLEQFALENYESKVYGGIMQDFLQKLRQDYGNVIPKSYMQPKTEKQKDGSIKITENSQFHNDFIEYAGAFLNRVVSERYSEIKKETQDQKILSTGLKPKRTSNDIIKEGQGSQIKTGIILNNNKQFVHTIDQGTIKKLGDIAGMIGTSFSEDVVQMALLPSENQQAKGGDASEKVFTFNYDKLLEEGTQLRLKLDKETTPLPFIDKTEDDKKEMFNASLAVFDGTTLTANFNREKFRSYMESNHPITLKYIDQLEENIANNNIDSKTQTYIDFKREKIKDSSLNDSQKLKSIINYVKRDFVQEDYNYLDETIKNTQEQRANRDAYQKSLAYVKTSDFYPEAEKVLGEHYIGKDLSQTGANKMHIGGSIVDANGVGFGDGTVEFIGNKIFYNIDSKANNFYDAPILTTDENGDEVTQRQWNYWNLDGTTTVYRNDQADENNLYIPHSGDSYLAGSEYSRNNQTAKNSVNNSVHGMQIIMGLSQSPESFMKAINKLKIRDNAEKVNNQTELKWGQQFYSKNNEGGADIFKAFQPQKVAEINEQKMFAGGFDEWFLEGVTGEDFNAGIKKGLEDGSLFIVDLNDAKNKVSVKVTGGAGSIGAAESGSTRLPETQSVKKHINPITGEKYNIETTKNGVELSKQVAYRKSDFQLMNENEFEKKYGITKQEAEEYYVALTTHGQATTLNDLQKKLDFDYYQQEGDIKKGQYQYNSKFSGEGTILSFDRKIDDNKSYHFSTYDGSTNSANVNEALKNQLAKIQKISGFTPAEKQTYLDVVGVTMKDYKDDKKTFYKDLISQVTGGKNKKQAIQENILSDMNIKFTKIKEDQPLTWDNIKSVKYNVLIDIKHYLSNIVEDEHNLIPFSVYNTTEQMEDIIKKMGY